MDPARKDTRVTLCSAAVRCGEKVHGPLVGQGPHLLTGELGARLETVGARHLEGPAHDEARDIVRSEPAHERVVVDRAARIVHACAARKGENNNINNE